MHDRSLPLASLFMAMTLAASAAHAEKSANPSAVSPVKVEEKAGVSDRGNAATALTIQRITATVAAIDTHTRMVALVGPQGNALVFQADDRVRNLGQVRVGDKVIVEYYEGVLAELASAGASSTEAGVSKALVAAAPGQHPAGAVGKAVTVRVTIDFIDQIRHVVHLKEADGSIHVVRVMKPEFRTMLKTLKPGDQVAVTFFEALAIMVRPAGK